MKTILSTILVSLFFFLSTIVSAQSGNTGIGTTDPQAKLHVAGDLRLMEGVSINKFSTDSLFTSNSHSVIPTEKAIKDYMKKGLWLGVDTNQVSGMALVPRSAKELGAGVPIDVAIEGDYAYVINAQDGAFSVWNIADRYNPVIRSQTGTNLSGPASIAVQNGIVYIASSGNDRLCLFNVSTPNSIVPLGFATGTMRQPEQVRVSGTIAYVKCRLTNAIHLFDVSNTAAPVQVSTAATGYLDDFTVAGNFLYGVNSSANRMTIVNATNPAAPVISAQYTSGMTGARCIYVKDNYAYVGLPSFSRLRIINVSDPVNPVYANQINADIHSGTKFRGSGRYLYLNGWVNEIQVFDIGSPTLPVFKGYNNSNISDVQSFAASGEMVIVPSYNNGRLCIFELDRSRQLSYTSNGLQSINTPWLTNGNMTYHAGDRVGIGVSDPKARFHVEGDSYLVGNVGIGMISPAARLGVAGNAYTTGNISIGTSDQFANLTFSNLTGSRIALWTTSPTAQYGMGIQGGLLQFYTDQSGSDFAFGYGTSTSFTEKMRIKGTGMVGIGTASPALLSGATGMHVLNSGYTQLRLESANSNAGIELKPSIGHSYEIQADNVNSFFIYDRTVGGSAGYRLLVNGSGYLGIGTTNPTRPLSFPATLEKKISFYPGATGDVGISVSGNDLRLYSDNVNARVSFGYDDYTNGFISRAYVLASGATAMVVQGQLNVNGTIYNSDARFKKNILTLENALDKVISLRGVQYEMQTENFPDRNFSKGTQIGLIAQEVEKVLPEVVNTGSDGYKSVDYAKVVPVLVESIKMQQEQIKALQQELKELRSAINKK